MGTPSSVVTPSSSRARATGSARNPFWTCSAAPLRSQVSITLCP
nr:hypothetical protein [Actinomadura sp. J1-007]